MRPLSDLRAFLTLEAEREVFFVARKIDAPWQPAT